VSKETDYARKVQEDTDDYIREILAQTQKLRTVAASLQAEKERLEDEVSRLRGELERQASEGKRLQRLLEQISQENQESLDRYQAVASQSASLANLYVATYRLHGTVDKNDVLSGIQEVVGNLIGCEELTIFEADPVGEVLRPVWTFGVDRERFLEVPFGAGIIGGVARTGETFIAGAAASTAFSETERDLSACVPLKVLGRVIGVIALFRLLPQKFEGLNELDYELLNLLQTHGATALYCTQLHAAQAADA
jgi:hypothetical protein